MSFKAIIFDLDGVICSTDEYHYRAWKALADKLGAPFDRVKNNRLRGVSRMASLEIVLETYTGPSLSDEQKLALATEKNEKRWMPCAPKVSCSPSVPLPRILPLSCTRSGWTIILTRSLTATTSPTPNLIPRSS